MARRGRVGSYQLSVFEFQIVAVFGRIRIVHLAHYSVRFEFESNIRYSPTDYSSVYGISTMAVRICRLAVMGEATDTGVGNIGHVRWQLCLCLLLAWILVALFVCKGIKSSGKVS